MPSSSTSLTASITTVALSNPTLCDMRLFPLFFCQGLFHDANSTLHRHLGIREHAAMSDGQYGGLSRQQFACTLQGEPFMPGSQRWQGEEQFEGPRNGHAAPRL